MESKPSTSDQSTNYTVRVVCVVMVVLLLEIFLGCYMYNMLKSDFHQAFVQNVRNDALKEEIREILKDPEFFYLYQHAWKTNKHGGKSYVEFFSPNALSKRKNKLKGDSDVWLSDCSRISFETLQKFCKATVQYCPGLPSFKRTRRQVGSQPIASKKSDKCPPGIPGPQGSPGHPGLDGEKGEQGDPGLRGEKGERGLLGPQGPPGEKGKLGHTGFPGAPGGTREKGQTGPPGLPGFPGEKGDKGETGVLGLRGVSGEKGSTGKDGLPGLPGFAGAKGNKGDTGILGLPGIPGEKGDTGKEGRPGLPGFPGAKGDKGDTGNFGLLGIRGEKGDAGESGQHGLPGHPGEKGDTGKAGTPGLPGAPGEKGDAGKEGQRGLPGFSGEKCTTRVHYNTQTCGSIFSRCKGDVRPFNPAHVSCQKGEKGEIGNSGLRGPIGPPGPPGLPGARIIEKPTSTKPQGVSDRHRFSWKASVYGNEKYPGLPPRTAECALHAVGEPKVHGFFNEFYGSWMVDSCPPTETDAEKTWVTTDEHDMLLEYDDLSSFLLNQSYHLKEKFQGNAHVIYKGAFYYQPAEGNPRIMKYSLNNRTSQVLDIPGLTANNSVHLYTSSCNYLDFSVDENGLWVIFGVPETNNTAVMKVDTGTMTTQYILNTTVNHLMFNEMFVTSGVLYAIDNVTEDVVRISSVLDLYSKRLDDVDIDIVKQFGLTTMATYDHRKKQLMVLDKGWLLSYPVTCKEQDPKENKVPPE